MPFLSIVIPVYQNEKFIPKCLDSILNGKFQDFEMLVVDDGSTDQGPAICDFYAQKDARIHVIHQENGGAIHARKTGILAAAGDYVTFIDSDDYITEGFDEVAKIAKEENPDVICSKMIVDGKEGQYVLSEAIPSGSYERPQIEVFLKELPYSGRFEHFGILPSCANKWFKRDLVKKWQLKEPNHISIGDDLAVAYPSISESQKIIITDIAYYHYNCNEDSMTKKYVGSDAEMKRVDVFYDYALELSQESFGETFFYQMDLYRIRLMLTAFEKEFSKANPVGIGKMFSRVRSVMKDYVSFINRAFIPEEITMDFNFRDIIYLWKKKWFSVVTIFVMLRKIEKKVGLVK